MTASTITPAAAVFDFQVLSQPADFMAARSPDSASVAATNVMPVFDWRFFDAVQQRTAAHRPLLDRPEPMLARAASRAGSRRPVLVVEDDRSVRDLLCLALQEQGLAVEAVRDGEEALDLIKERRPALVLLDMQLPGIGGGAVAGGIRARYDDLVPIVVVSAYGRSEQVRRLHPDGCLDKPFGLDDLYATVERALTS